MKSRSFTVGTTATLILDAEPANRDVIVHVIGAAIVYLGGSDVTTSAGTPTEKNVGPLTVTVPANEKLYAIVASSTEDVRVLSQGD